MADEQTGAHESEFNRARHRPLDGDNGTRSTPLEERPYRHSLAADRRLAERGNSSVHAQVLQRLQQTHGNRAVQRFLEPASTMPAAPRVSVQRRPLEDMAWPEHRTNSREEVQQVGLQTGAAVDQLGYFLAGPPVGTPPWLQTLNRHATGYQQEPVREGEQAVERDVVGVLPGIGTLASLLNLGHDTVNLIVAAAIGDGREARSAGKNMALDAIGAVPGVGTLVGGVRTLQDTVQTGRRFAYGFTPEGDPARPGSAERTREEIPLSGDLLPRFARSVFAAPPIPGPDEERPNDVPYSEAPRIPDEERPYCE